MFSLSAQCKKTEGGDCCAIIPEVELMKDLVRKILLIFISGAFGPRRNPKDFTGEILPSEFPRMTALQGQNLTALTSVYTSHRNTQSVSVLDSVAFGEIYTKGRLLSKAKGMKKAEATLLQSI